MADISKKLTLLRGLYAKMPEGGGKKAVASKIAKLEASQPKEVVEVKEQVKEVKEVIKKPKAPKKTSKGKEMRHVFEKKVDGGKEVKVVMATSVDLAKEAMQESGFDFNRTISRGRSPKEGFVASERPKKTKETKRPTKATRDEMAKAAGMTPEKAEKVATKVASAKKRGRKPAKHNAYLFEMPMKTQEGKVKRKLITATSQESAQKQVGKNYTFIKELKSGEKAKTGIQPIKDFVAPPPKRRGRRPRPKTQAEMDRMSDLYSKLGKKVKGQKSKKSKVAKKPKSSKKPSKITDSSIEFTALKKLAEEVTDLTEQLSFRVQVLNGQIEKFRNYEEKFAEGGEVKDKYAVGVRLFTEDEDEDEDDDSIGYGYIHIYASSPKEALAEAKRLSQSDEYVNIMEDTTMPTWYGWDEEYSWEINDDDDENPYLQMAKGGSTYAEGGEVTSDQSFEIWEENQYGDNSPLSDNDRWLWTEGYRERHETNITDDNHFYEWEENQYGDDSPLSDNDRIIWQDGFSYIDTYQ
jgi:hypothetical protein